jgi:hypothetical protein
MQYADITADEKDLSESRIIGSGAPRSGGEGLKLLRHLFSFEALFVLFAFAGRFKADPRFAWVPIDITVLFFGLSVIVGMLILLRRSFGLRRRALYVLLWGSAFLTWSVVSLLWTPGVQYAETKAVNVGVLVLWSLWAPVLIVAASRERVIRFLWLVTLFGTWVAFEALVAYTSASGWSVTVLGGGYLGVGRVIGTAAVVVLGLGVFSRAQWRHRILAGSVVLALLAVMLLTGGRGPFIAVCAAAVVPAFASFRISALRVRLSRRYLLPLFLLVMLGTGAVVYASQIGSTARTISRLMVLLSDDMGDSAASRVTHYSVAADMWLEKPLLGNGIGSYPVVAGYGDQRGYPHNFGLEVLAETGIIGIGLFIVFVWSAIRMLRARHGEDDLLVVTLLMLFVFVGVNSLFSGDLPDNRMIFTVTGLMTLRAVPWGSNA